MFFSDYPGKGRGYDPGAGHGEDGDALWRGATQDVRPIRKPPGRIKDKESIPRAYKAPARKEAAPSPRPAPGKAGSREVDSQTARKLKRGQYPVDMILDLHGHTQDEARTRLLAAVTRAYARDLRCLLVITGKGRGEGQGVLRHRVPGWLAEGSLSDVVLRWQMAQPADGGSGALYVLLRRRRKKISTD